MTKKELYKIYPRELHDQVDLLFPPTKKLTEDEEIERVLARVNSPLYRINSYFQVIDKEGNRIPFQMNLPQHKVFAEYLVHNRLIILKSRQQGITTLFCIVFLDYICHSPDKAVGIITVNQEVARILLIKIKDFWDTMDARYKEILGLTQITDNTNKMTLSNKSSIDVKTSFRGTTLHALHVSEMGEISNNPNKLEELLSGSFSSISPKNPLIIESTAKGNNWFKIMWDGAKKVAKHTQFHFSPIFLSWMDDPYFTSTAPYELTDEEKEYFRKLEMASGRRITAKQRSYWVLRRRETRKRVDFFREYPATDVEAFTTSVEGAYWSREYSEYIASVGNIRPNLYDRSLDVFIAMDLGRRDNTAMVFFQITRDKEIVIFKEYINNLQPISHYIEYIMECRYNIRKIYLPHDASQHHLGAETTIQHRFVVDSGLPVELLMREDQKVSRDTVSNYIPRIYIDTSCTNVMDAFVNYRTTFNPDLGVLGDKPIHDEYSHTADAIRYMCQGIKRHNLVDYIPPKKDKDLLERVHKKGTKVITYNNVTGKVEVSFVGRKPARRVV